jgi:heme/copper-type cytochrome/quinol oxidase subunit 2
VVTSAIALATAFFIYVIMSTKSNHVALKGFDKAKYELNKYHSERYWAVFIGALLIWFWFLGYPWMPPVAFDAALREAEEVHTIKVTAGQWFWILEDGGYSSDNGAIPHNTTSKQLYVKTGELTKFVATSEDVNHGFGVLSSSNEMDVPLFQMQVVPGYDNVFYYTFKKSETCSNVCHYTIRCLEYCGWNHPYMVSSITVHAV